MKPNERLAYQHAFTIYQLIFLWREFVHGVVLVVAAGQVAEHVPGQLVDALDQLR